MNNIGHRYEALDNTRDTGKDGRKKETQKHHRGLNSELQREFTEKISRMEIIQLQKCGRYDLYQKMKEIESNEKKGIMI